MLRTVEGFAAHHLMLCCAPKHAPLRTKANSAANRPFPTSRVCQDDTLMAHSTESPDAPVTFAIGRLGVLENWENE